MCSFVVLDTIIIIFKNYAIEKGIRDSAFDIIISEHFMRL